MLGRKKRFRDAPGEAVSGLCNSRSNATGSARAAVSINTICPHTYISHNTLMQTLLWLIDGGETMLRSNEREENTRRRSRQVAFRQLGY